MFVPSAAEIRQLRTDLGLTQQSFAHELGVSFSAVRNWEYGHKTPRGLSLVALQRLDRRRRRERELVAVG